MRVSPADICLPCCFTGLVKLVLGAKRVWGVVFKDSGKSCMRCLHVLQDPSDDLVLWMRTARSATLLTTLQGSRALLMYLAMPCPSEEVRSEPQNLARTFLYFPRCTSSEILHTVQPVHLPLAHQNLITCAPLGYDQSAVSAFISVTTDRSPSGRLACVKSDFAGEVSHELAQKPSLVCARIGLSQWQHTLLRSLFLFLCKD